MNDFWETPDDFFNLQNEIWKFDIDAAAHESNHKLPVWFGPGSPIGVEDCLEVRWKDYGDCFWLNPPYSRGNLDKFLGKAVTEWRESGIVVVALIPSDTSTKWWHDWVQPYEKEFIQGRIRFKGAGGSPKFGSVLLYLS